MSNKKSTPAARILAIVLAILMVVSMAFYTIYMIVDSIKGSDEEKNQEQEAGDTKALLPAYDFAC